MLISLLIATSLQAQTLRSDVAPKFMDGVHFACEASFDSALLDTAYHQGAPVVASGSISLYYWPDGSRLFIGMKLGIKPEHGQWTPPAQAYLINGYRSNLVEQQAQSEAESEGFRLFVYDAGGAETMNALVRLGAEGELVVAYTLDGGSMPMTFPVTLSDEHASNWSDCLHALMTRDR